MGAWYSMTRAERAERSVRRLDERLAREGAFCDSVRAGWHINVAYMTHVVPGRMDLSQSALNSRARRLAEKYGLN